MSDLDRNKIVWQIFQWAYDNEIDVSLLSNYNYGERHPEMRFSKGGSTVRKAFFPLTDPSQTKNDFFDMWKEIGLALCVEPFELKSEHCSL